MTRSIKVLCLIAITMSLTPALRAQTAEETLQWLSTFVAGHNGIRPQICPECHVMIQKYGVSVSGGGAYGAWIDYGKMKTIESWKNDDGSFIRITGTCEGPDGRNACDYFHNHIDIQLWDQSSAEDINRIIKALTHLAEVNGAAVNQKQPF